RSRGCLRRLESESMLGVLGHAEREIARSVGVADAQWHQVSVRVADVDVATVAERGKRAQDATVAVQDHAQRERFSGAFEHDQAGPERCTVLEGEGGRRSCWRRGGGGSGGRNGSGGG